MKTVQLAIPNSEYSETLRELLLRDGTHRVYSVAQPDLRLEGVIVIDANNGESLSLLQSDPERFLVVTADTSNSLARIWKAGARHVVFTKDSPNTAQLAIIATELQLSDEFSPEIEPHPLESAGTLHRPRVQ